MSFLVHQVRAAKTWLTHACFPRFCVSCREEGELLCRACRARWRPKPIVEGDVFSFFSYADPIARGLLQAWKYGFDDEAWRILRKELQEYIPHLCAWALARKANVCAPVPLFYVRRNERGFDQAEDIAKMISALIDLPYERLVRRIASTKPQAQKTNEERLQSYIKNPFIAVRTPHDALRSPSDARRVLLVDDVYTTGATMRAAGAALGEQVVGYVVLAMGSGD